MKVDKDDVRAAAEASFETFIRLVMPLRVLGAVHSELCSWITREDALTHQIVLLPRDHQKSAIAGLYAAWRITKNPSIRILYISSTSNLATKQLKFIKDILTSDTYRRYWPEMVNLEEAKREKWTETEISVDHPARKLWSVRDPTVFAAGLTTTITGLHCDLQILDDVVVRENAYTAEGRGKVEEQYSLLAAIGGAEFDQLVVGTRYHPKDLYNRLIEMQVAEYNDEGDWTGEHPLYEKFERQVEVNGEFLWPRQLGPRGRWFGFDRKILEQKRTQFLDKVQFRAQYYNDPNDVDAAGISRECFQYFDRKFLNRVSGQWHYQGKRLNVFAAIDFAYTASKRSDYTSIVIVGIDGNQNVYVLDIDRFQTGQISEYFKHLLSLYQKWDFRVLNAEVTAAQRVIVNDLKTNYIMRYGLALAVKDHLPTRNDGSKEERVTAILQPRYAERLMWHYQGGHCQELEEELVLSNPPHDDIKDCLASAIEVAVAPTGRSVGPQRAEQLTFHSKFGGIL